jgi:hypothetical protein
MPERYLIRRTGPKEKIGKEEKEMTEMVRDWSEECSRCSFAP